MSHSTAETRATVTLTIDGQTVEVKKGTTILQAARRVGKKIPTLCYLEKTHPIGSCRVCSVEVAGVDGPVMSCNTPASDGMAITTDSEQLKEFRRNMIQFILVNHPLDCPVCERSGECTLQNLTWQMGIKKHDWRTDANEKKPVVDWGLIRYDQNLCVMCERCVHVCSEVQGIDAYRVDGNGYAAKINTQDDKPLDCDFCGQCISVCPVGALSSGMYFSARSWEMTRTATICPHCAVGCAFEVNVKKGAIVRVTSNNALGTNKGNLCARGRFGYEFVQQGERLTAPMIRRGHGFETTDWDTALAYIAEKLTEYRAEGKNAFAGIGSERATNEDNYVFQKFFRGALGSGNIDNMANMASRDTASGLFETFGDFPMTMSFDELKQGNLFVFIGLDGSNENPVVSNHIREAIHGHGAEVALAYSKEAFFLPLPRIKLTYGYTELHEFVVTLAGELVATIKADGGIPGGAVIAGDFEKRLGAEFAGARAKLDGALSAQVAQLAALIKKKQKPVFLVGQEAQRHPQANAIVRNIVNIAKIAGGKVMVMREYCNSRGVNDMGVAPNVLPGYVKETRQDLAVFADFCTLINNHETKALIIADEDVLRRHADFVKFREAMDKVEFTVVIDQFYSQTAMAADVVLPSCTATAKDGSFTNIEGRIQRIYPAIEPVGNSRTVWRIFSGIAKLMGHDFGYQSTADVSAEIAATVPGYRAIIDGGMADYSPRINGSPALVWVDPAPMKKMAPGELVLLPEHNLFVMGIYTDYCPSLRHLVGKHYADFHVEGKPYVDINPADANTLGVKAEDTLLFKSPKREWKGRVRLSAAVKPGSVRIPDEMDQSPSVIMTAGGRQIQCHNLLGLMGAEKC